MGVRLGGTTPDKGKGLAFTLAGAPNVGDRWIIPVTPVASWAGLARVNNLGPDPNGKPIANAGGQYPGDYWAAMALFARDYPAVNDLLPKLKQDMIESGCAVT